jgi:hypothetical protein
MKWMRNKKNKSINRATNSFPTLMRRLIIKCGRVTMIKITMMMIIRMTLKIIKTKEEKKKISSLTQKTKSRIKNRI